MDQAVAVAKNEPVDLVGAKLPGGVSLRNGQIHSPYFLGLQVSKWLMDESVNSKVLESFRLPVLGTAIELAEAMKCSVDRLCWLAYDSRQAKFTHYRYFEIRKKGGGVREISAPLPEMGAAQRWIKNNILDRLPVTDQAHGFVAGRSIGSNASPHVGQHIVVNMDLKKFFPSIPFTKVRQFFEDLGYSPAVATYLGLICTERPYRIKQIEGNSFYVATGHRRLPQGACTSPGISNQMARGLDLRLAGFCEVVGLKYTRYADDLTFSGGKELSHRLGRLLNTIRGYIADEGFSVNEDKTLVQRPHQRQMVTGLVVNGVKNGAAAPRVSRRESHRIRGILHKAEQLGSLSQHNIENDPQFRSYLEGKIAHITQFQPALGAALRDQLARIPDDVVAGE